MSKEKEIENIGVSWLERVIINWATPVEFFLVKPVVKYEPCGGRFNEFFTEEVCEDGLWKAKVNKYKRLKYIANRYDGRVPETVLSLYRRTACGHIEYATLRVSNYLRGEH